MTQNKNTPTRVSSRDFDARAGVRYRTDSVSDRAPGPGPPRSAQPDAAGEGHIRQTVWFAAVSAANTHPMGWRGGFPTGRPWDFAMSRQGFRRASVMFPDPVPRIGGASRAVARALCAAWVRCSACRESLTPRCGTPLAATLTRIAAGRFFARCRVAWSLAAGPAVPALACFARRRFTPLGRSSNVGAFSNFVDQFPARRRRRNIEFSGKNQKLFRDWPNGYPPRGCNFRRRLRLPGA